ncbi:MAG: PAS domain-containing protein [Deltaproteobacteria bacterium]|nr:PAS domain-containing protein [Deltaproteobacteria bacterium]
MEQPPSIPHYKNLKRGLIVTVAILILLFAGFSAWKSAVEYRLTVHGAEMQSRGYARALKEHAERAFSEADNILLDTLDHIKLHGGIDKESGQHLRDFLQRHPRNTPQIGAIILVNSDGILFAHSLDTPVKQANVADREYFLHHKNNPGDDTPFLSRPIKSRINGKWRFTLSRPVRSPSGDFEGLIAVAFEMEYFQEFYKSLELGQKGRIVIMRKDGVLLIAQPFNEKDFSVDFSQSNLIKTYLPLSRTGTFHIKAGKALLESKARIISFDSLDNFPVVVNANMGTDEVTATWLENTYKQAFMGLVVSSGLIVLLLILLRQMKDIKRSYQRQSEQQAEISAAAASWRSTFDSVGDAIWVMDLDRNILRCNKATEKIFGIDIKQVVGSLCCELAHQGISPLPGCPFEKVVETGQRATMQLAIGDNWFEVSVDPVFSDNAELTGAVHIISDITTIKQAEAKALESDNRTRALLSAIPDAIFFKDSEGRWLLANNAGLELFCLQQVDYIGKTDLELAEIVPERREALLSCHRSDQEAWNLQTVVQQNETITDPNGKTYIFDTIKIPLYSSDGRRHGLVVVGRDMTEQLQLELQLRQAQKMEAIGHLAGGIAHDFNNLLTPILGYAEMIAARLPSGDPFESKVAGISAAAHKAKDLTKQLLNFGRRQSSTAEVVDLNEVILSFNKILRRTIRESIRIDLVLDPEGAFIKADKSQMEQIILNMTVNAQDAFSGAQGRINIETCKVWMDGENVRMHPGMVPGNYVLMAFRDNGCGMSTDVLDHIFEPFFTTKQTGHGTGLGLATVYGIVKQHEAHISVTSHLGEGTTFTIYFPSCSPMPTVRAAASEVTRSRNTGDAVILVVEDNDIVREMVCEMLEGIGYTILSAADPHKAIELLETSDTRIDLLLSDVVMPGMNGPELYEHLIVKLPDLKVVYISGYPINPSLRGGVLEDDVNYLQKPFTAEALLERIRQVL